MVKKESPVYLFIGEDALSKDIRLKRLKEELLEGNTQYFNLDVLYARELNLKDLQERLLALPLRVKKRILVIKESQNLKEDIKEFILKYVKKPHSQIVLVLDIDKYSAKDEFISGVSRYSEVFRFKEEPRLDTFALGRAIDYKKSGYALWVLSQLLRKGEKPERILGGLRYSWENNLSDAFQAKKKFQLLLNCDIDIKTGRLRPDFALERLVVSLCSLGEPSG